MGQLLVLLCCLHPVAFTDTSVALQLCLVVVLLLVQDHEVCR